MRLSGAWGAILLLVLVPSEAPARAELEAAQLWAGKFPAPASMAAFAPMPDARAPSHVFEGSLRLRGRIHSRLISSDPAFITSAGVALARTLPQDFDYEFVQDGRALIPVRRGPLPSPHAWWEFTLEPGEVWDEPGDGGFTRAALPFTLEERNANCVHHGVLTFLFGAGGRISPAAIQVSAETCLYLRLDLWGALRARYGPHHVADRDAVIAAYNVEVKARLPLRPESDLALEHPGMDVARLSLGDAAGRTLHGLVLDGVNYVSSCPTRAGDYPYCDVLDLPSYSTAKSVVAGLALMRLQGLTHAATAQTVSDWVRDPACQGSAWAGVSFADLINMATGNYDSERFEADEDAAKSAGLFLPPEHARKIHFACSAYPRRAAPGTVWAYHTSDTYLLGTALNAYFRSLPGHAGQDFFEALLVQPVFRELNLSPAMLTTRRTYDAVRQPFTGWGLAYHRDDIARLARFLLIDQGKLNGQSMFDPSMLAAALQQDPGDRGLPVVALPGFRYKNGFWARNVQGLTGCPHEVWVPFMSGFGGISVVLFPDGIIYYNFADDGALASFDWGPVVSEVDRLHALCRPAPDVSANSRPG